MYWVIINFEMDNIINNPSFDVSQIHLYYINLITDLKIKFAEEKGYMQSQINALEKNIEDCNLKLNTANQKIENMIQKTEKIKSEFEIDKFLLDSQRRAVENLLDISNKDISELQEKLKQITEKKPTDIMEKEITTKHKYAEEDKDDKDDKKDKEDNHITKKQKYNDMPKRILCYNFSKCNFHECTYGHSIEELAICPYGEYCNRKSCNYMFHSDENKVRFIEQNRKYNQLLCIEYYKNGYCYDKFCNEIH